MESQPTQNRNHLLDEIIADYLKELDRGRTPNTDELLAKHPEVAGELQAYVADMAEFELLALPLRELQTLNLADSARTPFDISRGVLGDFQILREVGRGGMGVVYEAEQISLGRRVALKVLPFAATMDKRHLQRFHNEARAAATLQHPHIVPVYAVGQERGVHYYAMQFVEGQTLNEIISDLKRPADEEGSKTDHRFGSDDPTEDYPEPNSHENFTEEPATEDNAAFRRTTHVSATGRAHFVQIAKLGIQAAEALEHAHQLGIVHRDIKPGNLMVDDNGDLWVTDFGLARIESNANLTMTGDVLGTLRYMSPEQALAKHGLVDHRTDVYSLGVTLYEMLTLGPAVRGENRQAILQQIAFDEPAKPRQLNKAIPPELETIVLKAIEKNPRERYASAKELAEDLGRMLRDEPITAKRATLTQRTLKWARRHPAAVSSMTVGLLVGLAALLVSLGWYAKESATRRSHIEEKVKVAIQEAEHYLANDQLPAALSAAQRADGLLTQSGVETSLEERTRRLVADLQLLNDLEQIRMDRVVWAGDTQSFDYEGVERRYEQAFREWGIDIVRKDAPDVADFMHSRSMGVRLAPHLVDWAECLHYAHHDVRLWNKLYRVAKLVDEHKWRNKLWTALSRYDPSFLAELLHTEEETGIPPSNLVWFDIIVRADKEAEGQYVAVLKSQQLKQPKNFWINFELGSLLCQQPATLDEGIGYYRAALAIRPDSAAVLTNLGVAYRRKNDEDEAIKHFREAIRLNPKLANAHMNLGNSLTAKKQLDEAIKNYHHAIRLDPKDAKPHYNLARALKLKKDLDGAIKHYRKAIKLEPTYFKAHNNLAVALLVKKDRQGALEHFGHAFRIKPDHPDYAIGLASMLKEEMKYDKALEVLEQHQEACPQPYNPSEAMLAFVNESRTMAQLQSKWEQTEQGKELPGEKIILGKLIEWDPFDRLREECHHDDHPVMLVNGKTYCITLGSSDFDTFLRLEDANKVVLGGNDDLKRLDRNSRIKVVVPATGPALKCRVIVTTYQPGETGRYILSIRECSKTDETMTGAHPWKRSTAIPPERNQAER